MTDQHEPDPTRTSRPSEEARVRRLLADARHDRADAGRRRRPGSTGCSPAWPRTPCPRGDARRPARRPPAPGDQTAGGRGRRGRRGLRRQPGHRRHRRAAAAPRTRCPEPRTNRPRGGATSRPRRAARRTGSPTPEPNGHRRASAGPARERSARAVVRRRHADALRGGARNCVTDDELRGRGQRRLRWTLHRRCLGHGQVRRGPVRRRPAAGSCSAAARARRPRWPTCSSAAASRQRSLTLPLPVS